MVEILGVYLFRLTRGYLSPVRTASHHMYYIANLPFHLKYMGAASHTNKYAPYVAVYSLAALCSVDQDWGT